MRAPAAARTSLRRQLLVVWGLTSVAGLSVAALLLVLHQQSTQVRTSGAAQGLAGSCGEIAARIAGVQPPPSGSRLDGTALANVVLQLVLAQAQGVEGGVWSPAAGHVAYAYPTYAVVHAAGGNTQTDATAVTKTDVPAAELGFIEEAAARSLRTGNAASGERRGERETVLISACPLGDGRAAWVMTRVPATAAADGRLLAGMTALLAMVAASSLLLGRLVRRWSGASATLESALAHAGDTQAPQLPPLPFAELQRLSHAVGGYATRMVDARLTSERLTAELGRHERLAALGRLTAAVAHEIRNPIATMRLTAENALAAAASTAAPDGTADAPGTRPLQIMLDQIHRLDGVVEGLLSMVQPIRLQPRQVALRPWLQGIAETLRPGLAPGATLTIAADAPAQWPLDPLHAARAIENLLRNALQHTPDGGAIDVTWTTDASSRLQLQVCNSGPPVPDGVRERLFEPFATGRAGGTGLGLAQAREVALAHGGALDHHRDAGRTCFVLRLPPLLRWPAS